MSSAQEDDVLVETRKSLHAVAEQVLAGPQYLEHATIRLRVTPRGFGQLKGPLRVEGTSLIANGQRLPLTGTVRDLATAAGVEASVPEGLYSDHAELGASEKLTVDPVAADVLAAWFERGAEALRRFAPDVEPVLWPEHFDLAITVDEVNYGVSPGDAEHARPYAYVGPWTPRHGDFWNAEFGALRFVDELPDPSALVAFFTAGRSVSADSESDA